VAHEPLFRLIAGLGNPGREYEATRHNVGFMILDRYARRAGIAFRHEPKWEADLATAPGVLLCKPRSYMNRSGEPLAALLHFYKIPAEQVLAVFDDAALPLGRLRIRAEGSSGGHNGMKSILQYVGDIPRLRVGIGGAAGEEMIPHVLGKFRAEEKPQLEEAVARAVDAIDCLQQHGLAVAMNQFN
jgi:PTH1 family peptidyl-tRNA hydrolase